MLCVDAGSLFLKKVQASQSNQKDSNYPAWAALKSEFLCLLF